MHITSPPFAPTLCLIQVSVVWLVIIDREEIMGESSASYIRMVQHLIEKCIIFQMSQEECMEALSKHANIEPVITTTVWKELEKENKEFFEAYKKNRDDRRMSQAETTQKIQEILSSSQDSQTP